MATTDNNNMLIEYNPSQVGVTDAANPTNAANLTIAADSTPANPSDSSTTISDNHNVDSTTGWKWRYPEIRFPEFKKTSILLDVRTELIKEFHNKLGSEMLQRFRESCFGAYLNYSTKKHTPGTAMHLMVSQQVIREGADEDELWFLVGDKFVRFSKYEYALVTGLRFGPTNFDPNEDYELQTNGVYRKFIDPENEFGKKGAEYEFVFQWFKNAPKNKKTRASLLKIAKVLFVHGFFYAIDKRQRIANWLWELVEREDEWETFPWGAYSFQILMFRMKNAAVKPQDNYHIFGFSHAFMHFILEAVPGLADKITSKTKHKCVQPRLLKRLFLKKSVNLYLDFFDKQDIQCHEKLEPTEQELIDYTWWPHVDDDVRSSVKYIHKESNAKKTQIKRTLEQSSVPAQCHGSITAEEFRPQKRARTTESPNADSYELLTRILEGVRQENELLEQRLVREIREIAERASRKSDDLRSEIEKLKKTVEELQRHSNYVPFEENVLNFEPSSPTGRGRQSPPPPPKTKTPSPPPVINPPSPSVQTTAQTTTQTTAQIKTKKTEQTKTRNIAQSTAPKTQKAQGRTPKRKTSPPPPSADDLYVPFDGNFIDDIEAFTDKTDYVRFRGEGEPEFTPIERLHIISKYPNPIKVRRVTVNKAKANKFITIRRAVRPPKDSEFDTYMNSDHMKAYIAYLESGSKEMRDCGSGMFQYEDASYFKEVENPEVQMDVQTIDSYLRILHLNPEFLGCHPEAREKYLIYPSIFCTFLTAASESMYHNNKASAISDKDKGQMEKLDLENDYVKVLLDIVQGKPVELIESWGQLVPITAVDKIYVVWLAHGHFYPLVVDLVKCEVWLIDSLANSSDEAKRFSRYEATMCLRRILPALLQLSGFYDVRKDLKPVNREWDLRFADKDHCFEQTDGLSCGPFACKMMEVLVTRRQLPNITEKNMKHIRRGIAERIFSFSKPAPVKTS
ncbi:hypothetical protein CASFOL_041901 [Castilleja foliolosa]|uniref:Ubiquitin-like protease family profile domain-containing protein n=1 Tax=Castilleja foliolosa TaxID=1961234 RepID=A0ABD3B919_9LAMI